MNLPPQPCKTTCSLKPSIFAVDFNENKIPNQVTILDSIPTRRCYSGKFEVNVVDSFRPESAYYAPQRYDYLCIIYNNNKKIIDSWLGPNSKRMRYACNGTIYK